MKDPSPVLSTGQSVEADVHRVCGLPPAPVDAWRAVRLDTTLEGSNAVKN